MSERYWITGVQLGMLKAILQLPNQPSGMINEITKKQFIGNYYTEADKNEFLKKIRGL